MNSFQELQNNIAEWSEGEFGKRQTNDGIFAHLKEEVKHLGTNLYDAMSYADVLILLMNLAARHNYTMDELLQATEAKHNINLTRLWEEPDKNGIMRHK